MLTAAAALEDCKILLLELSREWGAVPIKLSRNQASTTGSSLRFDTMAEFDRSSVLFGETLSPLAPLSSVPVPHLPLE